MGFKRNNVMNFGKTEQDDSWKAQGFINFYMPTQGGGRRKLISVPLKQSKPAEAALLHALCEDPETTLQALMNKLEVDFQLAEGSEASHFDLSVPKAEAPVEAQA
jgi:hypothetical protein